MMIVEYIYLFIAGIIFGQLLDAADTFPETVFALFLAIAFPITVPVTWVILYLKRIRK